MRENEKTIRETATRVWGAEAPSTQRVIAALDALLREHRAELKAQRKAHAEHMLRVIKALDAAGAPTYGDCSETLEMDERVAALKDQMTSPHASAALAAEKALVAYWKKKAETARAEALEEARDEAGTVLEPWVRGTKPTQQVDAVIEALTETRARIKALITKPAPATIPAARVREVLDWAADLLQRQGYGSGIIRDVRRRLGVDLDAKGEKDVHTEHCCKRHGCKYRDATCPVESGSKAQSFPCEQCADEGIRS